VAGLWAALAILVEPVGSTTSEGGSGVAVGTQSHLDTVGVIALSLLALVGALCLVAALMLFRGRRTVGCIALAIAFPIAFFVQVPAALFAAIALVWCLLAGRRDRNSVIQRPMGGSPLASSR